MPEAEVGSVAVIADIVKPTDGSDDAIRRAALSTASNLQLFARTWPEFYAFGLAVKSVVQAEASAPLSPAAQEKK